MEAALQKSEKQYRQLFENMAEAFAVHKIVVDENNKPIDYIFIDVNPAFESFTGLKRNDIVDKPVSEILPQLESYWLDLYGNVALTGVSVAFMNFAADLGKYYEVNTYSPRPNYFATIFVDVTNKVLAEKSLKESEERFRTIVEQNSIPMVIVDNDQQIISLNKKATELYGYTTDDVSNLDDWFKAVYPDPDYQRMVTEQWENDLEISQKNNTKVPPQIFDVVCKDRSKKIVEFTLVTLKDINVVTMNDITERIKAENTIKRSLDEKNILIKEVHHRVKNNMQVMTSLLRMQSKKVPGKDVKKACDESAARIYSMALVHELLYQSVDMAHINFKLYIKQLVQRLVRAYITFVQVKVDLDIQDDIELDIDRAIPCGLLLNEIITNSLKHAFKDRKDGQIKIALTTDKDGNIVLSVADDGVGFMDKSNEPDKKSLGTTLITALTEQLNGTLTTKSENGTKTTIVFPKK